MSLCGLKEQKSSGSSDKQRLTQTGQGFGFAMTKAMLFDRRVSGHGARRSELMIDASASSMESIKVASRLTEPDAPQAASFAAINTSATEVEA